MTNTEALKHRFENQITELFNTLLEIEKLEQDKPQFIIENWHQTALWMVFFSQVLKRIVGIIYLMED